jgi:tetratricopeptide (TPR) repeat protein
MVRNGIIGVLTLLAATASGGAAYAWQQLKTNEAFLNASLARATSIVDTAVTQAETYGVPRRTTLAPLTQAEGLFDDMAHLGRPTPELRRRKAVMLIAFARNYAILGDTGKWQERAGEAHGLLAELRAEDTDDLSFQRDLSVAQEEEGNVLAAQGNLTEALHLYQESLAIRERLTAADPNKTGWQRDLSVSFNKLGDVLEEQGDLGAALKSYRDGLSVQDRLAKGEPDNTGGQYDLDISNERIGDVLEAQGDLAGALRAYQAKQAIISRLTRADPDNAAGSDLVVSHVKIGEVLAAQGDLAQALQSFRDGLAIADRLAKTDPSNDAWQRDLSISSAKVGDVLMAQPDQAARELVHPAQ